jgi:hypothetical protein
VTELLRAKDDEVEPEVADSSDDGGNVVDVVGGETVEIVDAEALIIAAISLASVLS